MLDFLAFSGETLLATLRDVTPIVLILVVFQVGVLRRGIPNLPGIAAGSVMVLLGLALFLSAWSGRCFRSERRWRGS